LLHVLTDAGFTVSAMRFLIDALTVTRLAVPKWRKAGEPLYLRIFRSGPTGRTELEILRKEPGPPAADLTIIIDLAKLFTRVKASPE
jgi:hypothetical protein